MTARRQPPESTSPPSLALPQSLDSPATVRRLVESDLIGVAVAAADEIVEANDAFLRIIGYTRAELTAGQINWRAITPARWTAADDTAISQLLAEERCVPYRKEYRRKDGTAVAVEIGAALLRAEPLLCVCFVRDAAAEQAAEAAAARADRLAALTAALARDLTVADVAATLTGHFRRSMGAAGAAVMEAGPGGERLRLVRRDLIPSVTGDLPPFEPGRESPSEQAFRERRLVWYRDAATLDAEFPAVAPARSAAGIAACLAVPLIAGGVPVGTLAVYWPVPRELSADELSFAETVAGAAAQALARARLYETEQAARAASESRRDRLALLAQVTAAVSSALDPVGVVRNLGDLLDGMFGDLCSVLLAEGDVLRRIMTPQIAALMPGDGQLIPLDSGAPSAIVFRTGRPAVFSVDETLLAASGPEPGEALRALGVRTIIGAPLVAHGARIGVLTIAATSSDRPPFTDADLSLATDIATRVAIAVSNASEYAAQHRIAVELQRALLPVIPAELPSVGIGACYRPGEQRHEVGGDWYDVFELPGGRIGFTVGDVVGHDLQAAVAMGHLQQLLRYIAAGGAPPGELLAALDAACPQITGTDFATVGYAEYQPAEGIITYASAGHPPPLLVVGGQARYLEDGRSMPIGLGGGRSGPRRAQAEVAVPPGAMLLWYSDGLVERRDMPIDAGLRQLAARAQAQRGQDAQRWCDLLLAEMTTGQALADDVVIACLQLRGSPAAGGPRTLRRSLRHPDDLALTRIAVREWAAGQQLPAGLTEALLAATGEGLANALEHAYHGQPPGPAEITLERLPDGRVRAEISDHGRWRQGVHNRGDRGSGLTLMHRMADEVILDISRRGTRLVLIIGADRAQGLPG
jgi:PAS domain S-box-containing protein